jgi:hypothetical protein
MTTTQKFYTADEIKTDATERITSDEKSVRSYSYPIGLIWKGTERETIVEVAITAEEVPGGSHAFFEGMDTEPLWAYCDGQHGDFGPFWMEHAVSVAREVGYTTDDLLDASGAEYDELELGGDLLFFFDEEGEQEAIETTALRFWNEEVSEGERASSLDEIDA